MLPKSRRAILISILRIDGCGSRLSLQSSFLTTFVASFDKRGHPSRACARICTCEDYRAAAGIDLEQDRADDGAGRKIRAPLLALWGAKGTVGQLWDVLATWRPKTQAALEGQALPCGHLIPEEQPEKVISQFRRFFA